MVYKEGFAQSAIEKAPQSALMAYFDEAKKSKLEIEEKFSKEQIDCSEEELKLKMESENVAANLKYTDMPKFYRWIGSKNNGKWKKR